jgi:uncharacterized low-complexity protein
MSGIYNLKPVTAALGAVIATTLVTPVANADENPFSMQPLSGGYMVLAEGKCGEGKCGGKKGKGMCGMQRMDANGDGKVTREEFMQGHEAMFDRIDSNGDGVIDADEKAAHHRKMRDRMQEHKPGEGKCGEGK